MTLRVAARNQLDPVLVRSPLVPLLTGVLTVAAALLVMLAAAFAVRRLAGYWTQPLAGTELVLVGLLLVGVVSGIRAGWWVLGQFSGHTPPRPSLAVCWAAGSLIVLLAGTALSIAGTSTAALMIFWFVLVLSEATAWCGWYYRRRHRQEAVAVQPPAAAERDPTPRQVPATDAAAEPDEDHLLPPDVSQQITRARTSDGLETVTGLLRGDFAPGQRSQSLHVAFCPSLLVRPAVEVVQTGGPACHVRAADVQPHGVRFDMRLPGRHEMAETVLIYFEARAKAVDEHDG